MTPRPPRPLTAVLVAALVVYCGVRTIAFLTQPVWILDEPVNLVDAALILRGLEPHVDFWSMYPALNYWLNAFAFRVLGESVVAARLVQTGIYGLLAIAFVACFRQGWRLGAARSAALALFAVIAIGHTFTYYSFNGLAISLGGLLLALPVLRGAVKRERIQLVAAGSAVALGTLAKLNFGAYVGLAVGIVLLLDLRAPEERARRVRRVACFAAPVVIAIAAYLFRYRASLDLLWEDIIAFPRDHLEPHRILSLGTYGAIATAIAIASPFLWTALRHTGNRLAWIAAAATLLVGGLTFGAGTGAADWLPRLFVVTTGLLILLQWTSLRLPSAELAVWLSFSLYGHYFLSRADRFHYAALIPVAAMLAPIVIDRGLRFPRAARSAAVLLVLYLTLPVAAGNNLWFVRFVPTLVTTELAALRGAGALLAEGDSAVLMKRGTADNALARRLFRDADELEAARYVFERTTDEDPVYVGLRDHADVFLSPTRVYWVLGRRPGVRRHMLEPGMTTEDAIQKEMIEDLRKNRVEWLVLLDNVPGDPDYRARAYRGSERLDAHIRAHYRSVAVFGRYGVWRKAPP